MSRFRDYDELLVEHLKDPKEAEAYLGIALEEFITDHDKAAFLQALRVVAESQGGISRLSTKANLNRQNLYKALSMKGNPKLDTIGAIIKNMGFRLCLELDHKNSSASAD